MEKLARETHNSATTALGEVSVQVEDSAQEEEDLIPGEVLDQVEVLEEVVSTVEPSTEHSNFAFDREDSPMQVENPYQLCSHWRRGKG